MQVVGPDKLLILERARPHRCPVLRFPCADWRMKPEPQSIRPAPAELLAPLRVRAGDRERDRRGSARRAPASVAVRKG
jgi:hypothetical protein